MAAIAFVITLVFGWMVTSDTITADECTCRCCDKCEPDQWEWAEFHADAFKEYADEFTALFNSYETKRAKNGTMMIRQGDSGPYRFAKKGN